MLGWGGSGTTSLSTEYEVMVVGGRAVGCKVFRALMAWGSKLFRNLVVLDFTLLYRLPD